MCSAEENSGLFLRHTKERGSGELTESPRLVQSVVLKAFLVLPSMVKLFGY